MDECCPKCGTLILHAPGIGPYCPNPDCELIDDLDQVERKPLMPLSHCPTCKCFERSGEANDK